MEMLAGTHQEIDLFSSENKIDSFEKEGPKISVFASQMMELSRDPRIGDLINLNAVRHSARNTIVLKFITSCF